MQKKLIALAVAGLASSAAFAQSNVTVYGVVDVYYGNGTAANQATKSSVNSSGLSGSRIGFKGTEDLGNGLKALFTLEYGIDPTDNQGIGANSTSGTANSNTTSTTARQQFVGLTGGFGTAVAGRLQTAGYDWSAVSNTFHGSAINPLNTVQGKLGAQGVTSAVAAGNTLLGQSSRADNAVAYISPSFGGFVVAVNHARLSEGAVSGTTPATNGSSDGVANLVSGTYTAGPAVVSLVYASASTGTVIGNAGGTTNGHFTEWGLGGGYDFGVVNLKASYQRQSVDKAYNANVGDDKAYQISALIPVTAAGKVNIGWAKLKKDSTSASDDASSWTLAYLHSLSKRTTVYTGYQSVSNSGVQTLATGLSGASSAGGSAHAFVAGVNHSF
ncbi:MAG TPA: porin [Rhodocyclaceae bacterium]|jgi:predicted porin|nr:porin [Rhodocyclaceae bacterium]